MRPGAIILAAAPFVVVVVWLGVHHGIPRLIEDVMTSGR
jgi:hypothetical protein